VIYALEVSLIGYLRNESNIIGGKKILIFFDRIMSKIQGVYWENPWDAEKEGVPGWGVKWCLVRLTPRTINAVYLRSQEGQDSLFLNLILGLE
jgi:hypothetical protein